MILGALGAVGSQFVTGAGSNFMDKLLNRDEKDPVSEAQRMMDQLYPGTTPWERLGATGSGTLPAATKDKEAKQQRTTAIQIAGMQANAQIQAAQKSKEATIEAANINKGGTVYSADRSKESAEIQALASITNAQIKAAIDRRGQDLASGLTDSPKMQQELLKLERENTILYQNMVKGIIDIASARSKLERDKMINELSVKVGGHVKSTAEFIEMLQQDPSTLRKALLEIFGWSLEGIPVLGEGFKEDWSIPKPDKEP